MPDRPILILAMNVSSLDQVKAALEAASRRTAGPGANVPGAQFESALDNALKEVSKVQGESAQLQKDFQTGNSAVSLEQTMVAMQKSQIAFQATVTVRNRLISAYTDIMNMQV